MSSIKRLYIEPYFRWFDVWRGLFYDKDRKILYIQFIPFFGFKIWIKPKEERGS